MTNESSLPTNVGSNEGLGVIVPERDALAYARARISLLGAGEHMDTVNAALDAVDVLRTAIAQPTAPVPPSQAQPTRITWDAQGNRLVNGVPDSAPLSAQPVALTFDGFRAANVARCVEWHPAGMQSWSPSDWLTAVTGELGELASLLKMRNRERDGLPGNKFSPTDKQVADELADVLTYLDLLAAVLGVDLGRAAVSKFNEVSERVGFPDRIVLTIPPQPPDAQGSEALLDHLQRHMDRAKEKGFQWDAIRFNTDSSVRDQLRAALAASKAAPAQQGEKS